MGRIRTVKPEWAEDEVMVMASPAARAMSICLMVYADDYGRNRCNAKMIACRFFPGHPDEGTSALDELEEIGFIHRYVVKGQTYYEIVNWERHQRVDRPGKPVVPPPSETHANSQEFPGIPRKKTETLATDLGPRTKDLGRGPGGGGPPKKSGKATQLAESWSPNQAHRDLASELSVNVTHEEGKFKDWCVANGRRYVDWDRAFSGWLRRAAEWSSPLRQNQAKKKLPNF